MILDQKLKLVDNQSIASKTFLTTWTSPNKLDISDLRAIGKGEQVYCCVTIRETFGIVDPSSSMFSFALLSEGYLTKETAESGVDLQKYINTHIVQSVAGFSGFISTFDSQNVTVGKRYIFPINPFTAMQYTLTSVHDSSKNLYFAMNEVDATTGSYPVDGEGDAFTKITSGRIDVEIVTLAEPGAGAQFCDLAYYPTSMKVQ